jgi:UDP-glucuronate 4-epimerase
MRPREPSVQGKKMLFTGATGQALRPALEAMATDNEVWALGRFSDPAVRPELEAQGIHCYPWTMGEGDLSDLPDDFTHVIHGAPYRGQPDCNTTAQANAVGAGMLMYHCRTAEAFLFVSTFGVYARPATPGELVSEEHMLGADSPFAPTYPIGKMAAEGAVRAFASVLGLRSTIARLNVGYGPTGWGGVPVEFFARVLAGEPIWVPSDGSEIWASPISTDDITAFLPALFDVASPVVTIVNLAGDEAVKMRDYMTSLTDEAQLPVTFVPSDESRKSLASDNTRRKQLLGDCTVHWKDGMRRAIEAHYPGAFDPENRPEVEVKANIWGQR